MAAGCRPRAEPAALRAQAQAALFGGRVLEARRLVAEARSALPAGAAADPERAALRLLAAEIEIEADEVTALRASLAEVEAPLPATLAGGAVEARQQKVVGQIAHKLQDANRARRHLARAREAAARAGDQRLILEVDLARALVHATAGEPEAETIGNASAEAAAALGDDRLRALALNLLGFVAHRRDRYDQALLFLDPALAAARRAGAEAVVARVQLNRGICFSFLGHTDKGRALLRETAALRERLGLWAPLANVLGSLGTNHLLAHEHREAATHYQRALEIARKQLPSAVRLWARSLAAAYIQLQDWDAAERANEEARAQRGPSTPVDDAFIAIQTAHIADGRGDHARAERLLRELLATNLPDRLSERVAHTGLANNLYKQGRFREADAAFRALQERIREARGELQGTADQVAFHASVIRLHQQAVESLIDQNRVEAALEAAESFRALALSRTLGRPAQTAPATARALVALAASRKEALVAYFVAPVRSFAWVVTATGVRVVPLPGQAHIAAAVEGYRSFIEKSPRDPRSEPQSPGRQLYDLVVAPVVRALPAPVSQVVIAPDGPLFAAPFAALVAPGNPPRFWVEDVQISLAPALTVVPSGAEPARSPGAGTVLAFGASEVEDPAWPALPQVAEELAAIQRHFGAGRTRLVSGREARPEAYLRADLAGVSVVHFAAHALANPASPLDGGIILARGALGGRLSVRDVLAVPLAADLVTLSACRSAGTRIYGGEGLVGLAWGFLSAGARAVVAGLWDVGDRSTAALMDTFYAEVARGASAGASLRAAQLAMARAGGAWARPYYWAAFSAYLGPGRPPPERN